MSENTRPDPISTEEAREVVADLEFNTSDAKTWKTHWVLLRGRARNKGVECHLTFRQFMKLAKKAGLERPEQIGQKPTSFQMGRRGDIGNYEWGNCRFITQRQNILERAENCGDAESARKRTGRKYPHLSALKKGKTKEVDAGRMITSEKLSKKFIVTSDEGKQYKGKNLKDFCKKHKLILNCMSLVCRGLQGHHHGWTGRYISGDNRG